MLTAALREIEDARGDGCHLLATAQIFGAPHRVGLIRVNEKDPSRPVAVEDAGALRSLEDLADANAGLRTVGVPGFAGRYVLYVHPVEVAGGRGPSFRVFGDDLRDG